MKKLMFVLMIMVAGIAASAQEPPAKSLPKRYPVFMSDQEYQFIMNVLDQSSAKHDDVKAAQKFIGEQYIQQRSADTTRPKPPAPATKKQEKPKKKD